TPAVHPLKRGQTSVCPRRGVAAASPPAYGAGRSCRDRLKSVPVSTRVQPGGLSGHVAHELRSSDGGDGPDARLGEAELLRHLGAGDAGGERRDHVALALAEGAEGAPEVDVLLGAA